MQNYFQGNHLHPQHLSVGAVVYNSEGKICVHHYKSEEAKGYWSEVGVDEAYFLMRETLIPNETLEACLVRGLQEEFGIEGRLVDYLGTIVSHFKHKESVIEKTTIYFLVECDNQSGLRRDKSDSEGNTTLEWHRVDTLIPRMRKQAQTYKRTDIDESSILEKARERHNHL